MNKIIEKYLAKKRQFSRSFQTYLAKNDISSEKNSFICEIGNKCVFY